jgi:hypothetical protein
LLAISDENTTMMDAFALADRVLYNAVQGISDLITEHGMINVDFADVRTIMMEKGLALMGTGRASGEGRALSAAQQAISSPLLDNISIEGATGILINFTGGLDLKITEIEEAASLVEDAAHDDVNLIFGAVIDEAMSNEIKITVIATGFEGARREATPPVTSRHTVPGYRLTDTQSNPAVALTKTATNIPAIETTAQAVPPPPPTETPAPAPQSAESMNAGLAERTRRQATTQGAESPVSHRQLRLSTPRLRSMPPTGGRRGTGTLSLPPGQAGGYRTRKPIDETDLETPAITRNGGVRNVGEAPKGEEFWDRTMDDSVEMEAISVPNWLKGPRRRS